MKFTKTVSAFMRVFVGFILCVSAQAQRTATATPTVANGFVIAATVTDGGAGYTNAPAVTISGGGGSGATAIATVLNGAVDKVIVQNAGSGYTGVPVVVIAAPPSPKPPFSDGLVAYYPFNGDANDESGNGNTGKSVNVTFGSDRFAQANHAAIFSGDAYVECPGLSGIQYSPVTYSVWFTLESYPLHSEWGGSGFLMTLIGRDGAYKPNQGAVALRSDDRTGITNEITYYTGFAEMRTYRTPETNRWTHLVFTSDDAKVCTFYLNGQLVRSEMYPELQNAVLPFRIGASADSVYGTGRLWWRGAIDDVRIYNRALSAQEVKDLNRYEAPERPSLTMEVETVRVTLHVTPTKKYQLEASLDLGTWTKIGEPFVASSSEVVQQFNAIEVGRFFRIYEVQ